MVVMPDIKALPGRKTNEPFRYRNPLMKAALYGGAEVGRHEDKTAFLSSSISLITKDQLISFLTTGMLLVETSDRHLESNKNSKSKQSEQSENNKQDT